VLPDTEIRSAAGNAQIALSDGSRISVMPFSALRFAETTRGIEISLAHGRLAFSLPQQTHLEIVTPTARLEPVPGRSKAGEIFVTGAGLLGLKMSEGTLNVRPLSNPNDVMVASLEPVFLPTRPSMPGTYFGSDTETTPPAHAKAVFTPNGQSLGYVGRAGSLVIYPGYTNDLTRPFSPKLVRLAMNTIPDKDRTDDATAAVRRQWWLRWLSGGPVFYAQAPSQPPTQAIRPCRAGHPRRHHRRGCRRQDGAVDRRDCRHRGRLSGRCRRGRRGRRRRIRREQAEET